MADYLWLILSALTVVSQPTLRPLRFQTTSRPMPPGRSLIEWGKTRVICGVDDRGKRAALVKEQKVTAAG